MAVSSSPRGTAAAALKRTIIRLAPHTISRLKKTRRSFLGQKLTHVDLQVLGCVAYRATKQAITSRNL